MLHIVSLSVSLSLCVSHCVSLSVCLSLSLSSCSVAVMDGVYRNAGRQELINLKEKPIVMSSYQFK